MNVIAENAETIHHTRSNDEYTSIYILKIIAAFLVSWGHFLGTGTWQTDSIYGVIKSVPDGISLLPANTQILWKIETFFYGLINVQSAVIGVVLFFLASGFLIPHLQEKYNRQGNMPLLLFKRLEKLYPVTFVCVAIVGLAVYFSQGIRFPIQNYLGTALVSSTFTGTQMTIGEIWYLLVLVFLYLVCTIVSKISLNNLSYVYGVLYLLVIFPAALSNYPQCWIFSNIEYVAKFCGIPLLGTAAYLLKDEKFVFRKVVDMVWFFSLSFMLLRLDYLLYGTEHTYTNLWTYVVSFLIVAVSILLAHFLKTNSTIVRWLKHVEKYLFHFYMLHVAVGFTTIFWLRQVHTDAYVCVAAAYIMSAVVTVIAFHISKKLQLVGHELYRLLHDQRSKLRRKRKG